MKMFCRKIKAFTMAEVMVTMSIIGIISIALYGTMKAQTNSATRYQYYSAFINLKQAAGDIVADGYTLQGSTTLVKELSQKGNYAATDNNFAKGFCQKLMDTMNTVGTFNCATTTTTGFAAGNANFQTANGMLFYNLGSNPASNIYTIYIDINGTRDNFKLGKDVMAFLVNVNGEVYPYYNAGDVTATDGTNPSNGAINTNYLTAGVQYRAADGSLVVVDNGLSYRNAVCEATNAYTTIGCSGVPASVTTAYNNNCNTTTFPGRYCEVIVNKPGF